HSQHRDRTRLRECGESRCRARERRLRGAERDGLGGDVADPGGTVDGVVWRRTDKTNQTLAFRPSRFRVNLALPRSARKSAARRAFAAARARVYLRAWASSIAWDASSR